MNEKKKIIKNKRKIELMIHYNKSLYKYNASMNNIVISMQSKIDEEQSKSFSR